MIPITEDSFEPNGSEAIANSDRSPSISNSSTIGVIATAALKGKPPYNLSRNKNLFPSYLPQGSHYPILTIFQMGQYLSSVLSEAIGNSISLGKHFELPKSLIYTYVSAKIITDLHQIQVYLGDELVASFSYRLPVCVTPDTQNG